MRRACDNIFRNGHTKTGHNVVKANIFKLKHSKVTYQCVHRSFLSNLHWYRF